MGTEKKVVHMYVCAYVRKAFNWIFCIEGKI